jgi:hypothetical protein
MDDGHQEMKATDDATKRPRRGLRPWLIILLSVAAGVALSWGYWQLQPSIYQAQATLTFSWQDPVINTAFQRTADIYLAADCQRLVADERIIGQLVRQFYPEDTEPAAVERRKHILSSTIQINRSNEYLYRRYAGSTYQPLQRDFAENAVKIEITVRGDSRKVEQIAQATARLLADSITVLIMPPAVAVSGGQHPPLPERIGREYEELREAYRYFFVTNPPHIEVKTTPEMLLYPRGTVLPGAAVGLIVGMLLVILSGSHRRQE